MRSFIDIINNAQIDNLSSRGIVEDAMLAEYDIPKDSTLAQELEATGDVLLEMANLEPEVTGIDAGFIFISTQMASHGPRVKFFLKLGRNQPSMSVSISTAPKVIANSLPERVVNRVSPLVCRWVALNQAALLNFWNSGESWTSAQVQQFIAGLQSL
jgi:hypothetical protein